MAIKKVFKVSLPSVNYVFRNGKPASFVGGKYLTDIPDEIAELEDEISKGHPLIFVDPNELEMDEKYLDPMVGLREKIIAEFLENQAKANDPTNDMGTSTQGSVIPANSQDVAVAAAGGSGATLVASLAALKNKTAS